MATRQQSRTSTRVRKPRIQCVLSEPLCAQLEELAKERGTSVSACCAWIVEQHFQRHPIEYQTARDKADDQAWANSPDLQKEKGEPDMDEVLKMFKLMKMAKESGLF